MTLVIKKITTDNINQYFEKISMAMYYEYVSTYNEDVDIRAYTQQLPEYMLQNTYVLVWQAFNSGTLLLGYFSLSGNDWTQPTSIFQTWCNRITRTYFLSDVYVFPEFRTKGVGKYLVSKAVETARILNSARWVILYTSALGLSYFYAKNKFRMVGSCNINGFTLFKHERKVI